MSLALLTMLACWQDPSFERTELTCRAGGVDEPLRWGATLADQFDAWRSSPPVVASGWDENLPGFAADSFTIAPVALSPDATVCDSPDGAPRSGFTDVTVQTSGEAWLPSGTYPAELRVGAFPAELIVTFDVALPSSYQAAAKAVLEEKADRPLSDEEVPVEVTLEASAWLNPEENAFVALYYRGEDIAPLLFDEPTEQEIRSAQTMLALATNVDR